MARDASEEVPLTVSVVVSPEVARAEAACAPLTVGPLATVPEARDPMPPSPS